MALERREHTEEPETLRYASRAERLWTPFQASVTLVCAAAWLLLGLSTADMLYRIPGKRYLFGATMDMLGMAAALASPVILGGSLFTRERAIITAAASLVVLAVIWTVRCVILLTYL
ncbi:MAG: hypothetical protein IPM18_00865 [Phycisphaerales bacterium]|nr:hypothetical protein [Phycisphaerales bacterium]